MAPRDRLEYQIVKTWEQVLGIQPIGVQDNFFALGGHSLLAVRLCARLEQVCRTAVPLMMLFQVPTVAQLANRLRQAGWSAPPSRLVPYRPGGSKPPCSGTLAEQLTRCLHQAQATYHLPQSLVTTAPYTGARTS